MYFFSLLKMVLRALGNRKKRTFLAMLGVAIGVAAVVTMVALGEGSRMEVIAKIEGMGTNLLVVSAGKDNKSLPGKQKTQSYVKTLTTEDSEAIEQSITSIISAVPVYSQKIKVKYDAEVYSTTVMGTLPDIQQVCSYWLEEGTFFSTEDVTGRQRVAVVGKTLVDNIFRGSNPIGEYIKINNIRFQIIGVLAEKGLDINGQDQDDLIIIPLSTAMRKVFNVTYLSNIFVEVNEINHMKETENEITTILMERHRINKNSSRDFTTMNQAEVIETQNSIQQTFTALVTSVAGVALFIGGIGILAVMLISIRERTWEIGLRRALGARKKDILLQFILEAIVLSFGGSVLGIALGLSSVFLLGSYLGWPTYISYSVLLYSVLFTTILGLIFGVYPAKKAALLNPIDALRS